MFYRRVSIKRSRVSFDPLALPVKGFAHSPAAIVRAGLIKGGDVSALWPRRLGLNFLNNSSKQKP
jgi:hypothetical protein